MIEKIPFTLFGLDLLEPMAMITNLLVMFSCIYGFQMSKRTGLVYWNLFFGLFALASFFGGLSHAFWNYWEFTGKIPPWFFGVAATSALTYAMAKLFGLSENVYKAIATFIIIKGLAVLTLAYCNWNFLFVAIDTIASLLLACGVGSAVLYFKLGNKPARFILFGVLTILPAAFIFLFKFDLHRWMNREDLSHVFMALGLLFFVKFTLEYSISEQ